MSCNITIPPFPSQDLAKLVLGYLAEEQLMTAYDEFLQASPYLDALQNEYDRIFMTSLKNILAEYRAVKIYVETCKPFVLRRKLFQCTNLLETVKFLISNVDINKLHIQDGEKAGLCRQYSVVKANVCDICSSLTLPNCVCKTRGSSGTSSQSTSQIEASSLESSVETTSLSDLPGNISHKKKTAKLPEEEVNVPQQFISSSDQITNGTIKPSVDAVNNAVVERSTSADNVISSVTEQSCPVLSPSEPILVNDDELEPQEIVQESNDISKLGSKLKNVNICKDKESFDTNTITCKGKKICKATSFQDFASGVGGDIHKVKADSSTSENFISQAPATEVTASIAITHNVHNSNETLNPQFLLKTGNMQNNQNLPQSILPRLAIKESHANVAISLKSKHEKQNSPKITILSDIKVDKDIKIPPMLKNATSTPLTQWQTLFINGTPAYKQTQKQSYTKDEIMAMPTIILVPSTGESKNTVPTVTQRKVVENTESTANISSSAGPTLEPLVIDVTASNTAPLQDVNKITKTAKKVTCEIGLLKTADVTSHASVPKDNALNNLNNASGTPQVPPPTRKSSSTPRRSSHVRVLDFTTPRRILHETINEQVANQCSADDVVSTGGSSLPIPNSDSKEEAVHKIRQSASSDTQVITTDIKKACAKENKAAVVKSHNWDAELRALAVANGPIQNSGSTQRPKPKKIRGRLSPKNKSSNNSRAEKSKNSTKKSIEKKKKIQKIKSPVAKKESLTPTIDIIANNTEHVTVPIKPTINIICANKWNAPQENDKSQSKTNNSEERIDTPELESMSLQNEIGAKLNISDLLETPYKQALYDIQMETPRFACPDIPGEPLSDIKIMNIPTPKYLNTPKISQNTPSSYSSRPTDYSSGGSYYKPDDQDYVLATEVLEGALSTSGGTSQATTNPKPVKVENICKEKVEDKGKTRPVRQCTKNVSYKYCSPSVSNKMKEVENDMDKSSSCSDTSIIKACEKKFGKCNSAKSCKSKDNQLDIKKNFKKYKSPVKKDLPKSFMKIKPRRTTPIKENLMGRGKKKSSDRNLNIISKSQPRKRMSSKEKHNVTPINTAAPTKSRRKSSTPRKINCTKIYNSENSVYDSSEISNQCGKPNATDSVNLNICCSQDSDTEQLPLRWSDDGSQESKQKDNDLDLLPATESEDISKIKEYINTTVHHEVCSNNEGEGTLHVDLIKRGFDIETARMIERDLLETPTQNLIRQPEQDCLQKTTKEDKVVENVELEKIIESNSKLQSIQQEDEMDELDLSVYECNEETENYMVYNYNEATFIATDQIKLKEKFSMEICMDDDLAIRLRATPLNIVFEQESKEIKNPECNEKPIEKVVNPNSISTDYDIDNLYTPRKAQVYEIFDSTLTSLDTPLKVDSPRPQEYETTVTEIVLEVEKLDSDVKDRPGTKKRKRLQSGNPDDTLNNSKKAKPDTPYILNSTSIQNIDIESVLSKLHGP